MQVTCDRCQRGGCARCRDYVLDPGTGNALYDAVDLARDEATQAFQFTLTGRVVAQEFIRQANGAERKTDGVANVSTSRNSQFTTSPAKVQHQSGRFIDARTRNQTEVNQPCLFDAGDDLNAPAGRRMNPLQKSL